MASFSFCSFNFSLLTLSASRAISSVNLIFSVSNCTFKLNHWSLIRFILINLSFVITYIHPHQYIHKIIVLIKKHYLFLLLFRSLSNARSPMAILIWSCASALFSSLFTIWLSLSSASAASFTAFSLSLVSRFCSDALLRFRTCLQPDLGSLTTYKCIF